MTTVVTGSAGHLGEAIMRTLRAGNDSAVGVDIAESAFTDARGSITDRDFVRRALKGARRVIHTATLHKPHLATHSPEQFVDTNIRGTLVLLEEAVAAGVESFVFTSTTSAFGAVLSPGRNAPPAWITEETTPAPKNMYGTSKLAAEQLCEMFHRRDGLPVLVLRTSRFFPEPDDDPVKRAAFALENVQVLELLYRRVDLEDVVSAHLLAAAKAPALGFARFVISATTPFTRRDLAPLGDDFRPVVERLYPQASGIFAARGWRFFDRIDRVYVNDLARTTLGWSPKHDFGSAIERLARGGDHRSAIARDVGIKGYHAGEYADGIYPIISA